MYLTSVMTLHPGDVVLTGAPGPSRRLRPGGRSHVTIPGIGTLANPVATTAAETALTAAPQAAPAGMR